MPVTQSKQPDFDQLKKIEAEEMKDPIILFRRTLPLAEKMLQKILESIQVILAEKVLDTENDNYETENLKNVLPESFVNSKDYANNKNVDLGSEFVNQIGASVKGDFVLNHEIQLCRDLEIFYTLIDQMQLNLMKAKDQIGTTTQVLHNFPNSILTQNNTNNPDFSDFEAYSHIMDTQLNSVHEIHDVLKKLTVEMKNPNYEVQDDENSSLDNRLLIMQDHIKKDQVSNLDFSQLLIKRDLVEKNELKMMENSVENMNLGSNGVKNEAKMETSVSEPVLYRQPGMISNDQSESSVKQENLINSNPASNQQPIRNPPSNLPVSMPNASMTGANSTNQPQNSSGFYGQNSFLANQMTQDHEDRVRKMEENYPKIKMMENNMGRNEAGVKSEAEGQNQQHAMPQQAQQQHQQQQQPPQQMQHAMVAGNQPAGQQNQPPSNQRASNSMAQNQAQNPNMMGRQQPDPRMNLQNRGPQKMPMHVHPGYPMQPGHPSVMMPQQMMYHQQMEQQQQYQQHMMQQQQKQHQQQMQQQAENYANMMQNSGSGDQNNQPAPSPGMKNPNMPQHPNQPGMYSNFQNQPPNYQGGQQ